MRVYVMRYTITYPNGQQDHRQEAFFRRDDFVVRYLATQDNYYISNLYCFYGELEIIEDVGSVVYRYRKDNNL